ncbi:MAG TPA: alkaline shock response membrane anchor protein AmaP [Pontiella sp.]
MKSRPSWLGRTLSTFLLLLIGVGLIYGSFFKPEVGKAIGELIQVPIVGGGIGAILILSLLLRWTGGLGSRKDAYINFSSDDGSVGISTKAIQDFIERVAKEFAAVKSVETKLIQRKKALDIAIFVQVMSGNKIPELSQVLQQRVRESVRESLGLDEIRNITLQIKEIIGEPAKIDVDPTETE